MADFDSEIRNIKLINNYYNKIPIIYENGIYNNKNYIVLSKIEGNRLSDILKEKTDKKDYLFKYGKELAKLHNIPRNEFLSAKQRIINDYPKDENYSNIDNFINKYILYYKK